MELLLQLNRFDLASRWNINVKGIEAKCQEGPRKDFTPNEKPSKKGKGHANKS